MLASKRIQWLFATKWLSVGRELMNKINGKKKIQSGTYKRSKLLLHVYTMFAEISTCMFDTRIDQQSQDWTS